MKFEPQSEDDIDREMLLRDGTYDFEVASAQDTVSKAGNDMIALQLRVFSPDGSTRLIRDWLLPAPALSKKKLSRFCKSVGLGAKYDAGDVTAADCEGRAGKVIIRVKDQGDYGMQAVVETYEVAGGTAPTPDAYKAPAPPRKAAEAPVPEDCPF